jgi:nucleoside-diphosphate-sugar epimerase
MNIVVTGVSSFIGAHLASYFSINGNKVIGTITNNIKVYDGIKKDRLNHAINSGVIIDILDITNSVLVADFINKYKPVYWFHHAGWAKLYGSESYDFNKSIRVNVIPLQNIYNNLRKVACKGIIITGSSAEYSDSDNECEENDLCMPSMPYGLSKLFKTIRASQLAYKYQIHTRIARIFIPYGPLDANNKLLPTVIDSLLKGNIIDLSPCKQYRDFIYINDLVNGYALLLNDIENGPLFDIYNLCSGIPTKLEKFLELIAKEIDVSSSLLNFGAKEMRPGELKFSFGSCKKITTKYGWSQISLEYGIKKYIDKIKNNNL